MASAMWRAYAAGGAILVGLALPVSALEEEDEEQLVLKGNAAQVTVEVNGGAITDFRMSGSEVNPLDVDWSEVATTMFGFDLNYPWRGHFVFLDRFGFPSEQELKNGMVFHGEASQVPWEVTAEPALGEGAVEARMACTLQMAGLQLQRTMRLSEDAAVLSVQEAITNTNALGRLYNNVQHANIQTPFLDESVVLDCNATTGFLYQEPIPKTSTPSSGRTSSTRGN